MSQIELSGLHQDIVSLSQGQLSVIDRLLAQLDEHVVALKTLLVPSPRSEDSRKKLVSGKVEIGDVSYEVNSEFQQTALEVAEILDLDELKAADLVLTSQEDVVFLDRPLRTCAILRYRRTRSFLLDSLRLWLSMSNDIDIAHEINNVANQVVDALIQTGPSTSSKSQSNSAYTTTIQRSLERADRQLEVVRERAQKGIILGQPTLPEMEEILSTEHDAILLEHEYLASILVSLIKAGRTEHQNVLMLLDYVSRIPAWGPSTLHYVPAMIAFFARYGSPEFGSDQHGADQIHQRILSLQSSCALRTLGSSIMLWWIAEYSTWFSDDGKTNDKTREKEFEKLQTECTKSLQNDSLATTLSICAAMDDEGSEHAARTAITKSLLDGNAFNFHFKHHFSKDFQTEVMAQMESFIHAFITNLPDTLRAWKSQEDYSRKVYLAHLVPGDNKRALDQERYLETFLIVMAFAFRGRPEASEPIWEDDESNVYGFLQWASRRQTTPCIAAFCEMFRSITEGDLAASAAHKFLMSGSVASSRSWRSISLTWSQMFEELQAYASRAETANTTQAPRPVGLVSTSNTELEEPDSASMLECYLRLIGHLCKQSASIRTFVLGNQSFSAFETLFGLARISSTPGVRACVYSCLEALLTEKQQNVNDTIWDFLDRWVHFDFVQNARLPIAADAPSTVVFNTIIRDFEESNAFVSLLDKMIAPVASDGTSIGKLPFPARLGTNWRMPGIDLYVDFVMDKVLSTMVPALLADGSQIAYRLAKTCMQFAYQNLASLDMRLLDLVHGSEISPQHSTKLADLPAYIRLHPFARTSEWLLNQRCVHTILRSAHHRISEINNASIDAPIVQSTLIAIRLLDTMLNTQSTYANIMKPLIKEQPSSAQVNVSTLGVFALEDILTDHLGIISDLGFYISSGYQELALLSLSLLSNMAASRKLNVVSEGKVSSRLVTHRLIGALQESNDLDAIAKSLIHTLEFDPRELAISQTLPSLEIKISVIAFLRNVLLALPDKPTLAHVLLGFEYIGSAITLTELSPIVQGSSVFHALVRLLFIVPDNYDGILLSNAYKLKAPILEITQLLAQSTLTANLIIPELHRLEIVQYLWMSQPRVSQAIAIDSVFVESDTTPEESFGLTWLALLTERACLYSLAATMLRSSPSSITTPSADLLKMLRTNEDDIDAAGVRSSISMLDFLDVQLPVPHIQIDPAFQQTMSQPTVRSLTQSGEVFFNVSAFEQLRSLDGAGPSTQQVITADQMAKDKLNFIAVTKYMLASNINATATQIRLTALESWSQMFTALLMATAPGGDNLVNLTVQALDSISLRLERAIENMDGVTLIFLRMLNLLLSQFERIMQGQNDSGLKELVSDRLLPLLKGVLRALKISELQPSLRLACYQFCTFFLSASSKTLKLFVPVKAASQAIRSAGDSALDVICEDAFTGDEQTRSAAMSFIEAMLLNIPQEDCSIFVQYLIKSNFVTIVIDALQDLITDMSNASEQDIPVVEAQYKSCFSVLLAIAKTKLGAIHVSTSDYLAALSQSGLLEIDPDVGIGSASDRSTAAYHELLLASLRIIVAMCLARTSPTLQLLDNVRAVLARYRQTILGILKLQNRSNTGPASPVLDDLSDVCILLLTMTGFTAHEEESTPAYGRRSYFS